MTAGDHRESVGTEKRRFLADVAAISIATYLSQPILFVSSLLTRRWLGPLLIGTFATLTLIQQYATLLNLGVIQAADRELPFFRGANDPARCDRIRTAALTVALTAGAITSVSLFAIALVLRSRLTPAMFHGLLAYSLVVISMQWWANYVTFLRADRRFQPLARINLMMVLATAAGSVLGAYLFHFEGLVAAIVLVNLLGCAAYTRAVGLVRPRFSAAIFREAKSLIALGIPLSILGFGAMGVHTMGSVAVLKLLGTEALGVYTIAISGGNVIHSFANSIGVVIYPRMREDHGRTGSDDAILRFAQRPVLLLASALPLLIAPLFFLLPVVVGAVVPKFIPGIPAFRITVIGVSLYALAQIPGLCLVSLGKTTQLLGWYVLTLLACAGAALALIGFGLEGMAIAAAVGHLVGFVCAGAHVVSMRESARSTGLLLARAILPIAYTAVVLALMQSFWKETSQAFFAGAVWASAKTLVFLVLYLPILVLLERQTHLFAMYLLPAWRRIRGRRSQ